MCDTVTIPGNLMIIEPSSGERNVCDKLRGIGEKKAQFSVGSRRLTSKLEATDESNMVDEIRDSWANWYRPSSTFRVSISTRRSRTASHALILKTCRSFNLMER